MGSSSPIFGVKINTIWNHDLDNHKDEYKLLPCPENNFGNNSMELRHCSASLPGAAEGPKGLEVTMGWTNYIVQLDHFPREVGVKIKNIFAKTNQIIILE